jgi:hypothetical protein
MRLLSCLVLSGLLLAGICAAARGDGPDALDLKAAVTARSFLDRAAAFAGAETVPKALLSAAYVGQALPVLDARTLDVAYRVVPILSGGPGGGVVGIVGIDPKSERTLWCRFGLPGDRFPGLSADEARQVVRARRAAVGLAPGLGLGREPGAEPDLSDAVLVQGCDKHIYWRFASADGAWYVDAVLPEAPVLASLDGSSWKVTTPEPAAEHTDEPPAGEDLGLEQGSSPDAGDGAAFANPAAYLIPGLPYHFQIVDWYCGPASLQMIMDWLGEEVGQYDIGDVANEGPSYGCMDTDMRRAAHFSGMSTAIQNPALQGYAERKLGYACIDKNFRTNPGTRLKNTLCAGYPVFTVTYYDGSHTSTHFRVVKGYDDSLGVFVIHDPWYYGAFSGPDLLIDQTFFVDDLWAYAAHWCLVASPWILSPSVPSSVAQGDTFTVSLRVLYPGPGVFAGNFPSTDCQATLCLESGLALAAGSPTITLPDLDSGDTVSVSWDVVAVGSPGDWELSFQAQGIVAGSSTSYASYSDSIGGHASEKVAVGPGYVLDWDEEEQLTTSTLSSETCFPAGRAMAVGPDGKVHVVWADTRDGNGEIYYRQRDGATWGAETRITSDIGYSHSACIAADPEGNLHVAWVDDRDGNPEIYYKQWSSVSGWSADERVTDYYEVDSRPAIAASASKVYLAWESRVDGYYRVATAYLAVRSVAGWSAAVEIDPSTYRDRYRPSVAIDPEGRLHVVYERQTADVADENEEVAHRTWNGVAWSAVDVLSSSVSYSRDPVVVAASDGTTHVVWQDGENVGGDIFYARHNGTSWGPVEELVTGSTEAGTPSIAVDGGGQIYVVWSDTRNGESEIYLLCNDGISWGSPHRLRRAAAPSLLPTVAAGAAYEAYVVWTDLRGGNSDLFFRGRSDLSGAVGEPVATSGQRSLRVSKPWPVPSTGAARVSLGIDEAGWVDVQVFDVAGRSVKTLLARTLDAGAHDVVWDGRGDDGSRAAAGIYFLTCSGLGSREVRRVVLVR